MSEKADTSTTTPEDLKIRIVLEPKDFKDFRSFEKAIHRQLGNDRDHLIHVGTDSVAIVFQYPEKMKAALYPFNELETTEIFTLSHKKK